MNHYERVMAALRREQPDRVPHFEWYVDKIVRKALFAGKEVTHNVFALHRGHDALLVSPIFGKEEIGKDLYKTEWGYVIQYNEIEDGIEMETPIKSLADLDTWSPPDVLADWRYADIDRIVKEHKGEYAIGVHLSDVFSIPRYLIGMQNLLVATLDDQPLVKRLVEISVEQNIAMAKECARRGVDFVWTSDDVAYRNGPLVSKEIFRELFFPGLCEFGLALKQLDLPFIKHTAGNVLTLIDLFIDAGVDCIDPLEPISGVDMLAVKKLYGDRIAIKGNVDASELLTLGTTNEVRKATRDALKDGMPGGGFICSSSGGIHCGVPPRNYKAMLEIISEYGKYAGEVVLTEIAGQFMFQHDDDSHDGKGKR